MEKIKFVKGSSFKDICDSFICDSFNNFEYSVEDYKGEGVYCFIAGCRGVIDNIIKVSDNNEFELSSKEELIEECKRDSDSIDSIENEYLDEFCESGKVDDGDNDVESYFECLGEEDSRIYFYIVE